MLHRQCQLQNDMSTSDTNNDNAIKVMPMVNGVGVEVTSEKGAVILTRDEYESLHKKKEVPQKTLPSPSEILQRFSDRNKSLSSLSGKLDAIYYNLDTILDSLGLFGLEEFKNYDQDRRVSQSESTYIASSVDVALESFQSKEAIYKCTLSEMAYKYLQSLILIDYLDKSCFGVSFYRKVIDFLAR